MKEEVVSSNDSIGTIDDMNALVDELVNHVERMPTSSATSSSNDNIIRNCVMKLKSLHNNLHFNMHNLQNDLNELSRKHKVEQVALDALQYERHHLQYDIDTSSKYKTPKLKLLAKQIGDNNNNKDNSDNIDPNNLLFDGAINMNDPKNRQAMINRLHEEMNIRASLEQKLKNRKRELKQFSDELNVKRRFINTLPEQLSTVERASLPLQKLVQRYSNNTSGGNTTTQLLLSSERYERMQCAKKLPAPLYTLFRQIQYYLDNTNSAASNKMTVSVVAEAAGTADDTTQAANNASDVVLTVPVPDIKTEQSIANAATAAAPTAKQKRISLHFKQQQFVTATGKDDASGDEEQGNDEEGQQQQQPPPPSQVVVTVSVTNGTGPSGATNLLFADTLLDELFPNDIGLSVVVSNDGGNKQGQLRRQQQQSYYYHWANYMAGLSLSTATVSTQDVEGMNNTSRDDSSSNPPRPLLCHSTRVIMHEINRRIRSNAILKYILQQLQQHRKLPVLPVGTVAPTQNNKEEEEESALLLSQCQIQSCVAERSESKSIDDHQPKLEQSYVITLRNKTGAGSSASASSWKIKVKVNLARYPAVPPVWTLINSNESNGGDLYDSKLEKIQRYVNEGLLLKQQHRLQQQGGDGENSNNNNKDTNEDLCADWILVQQLRSIICKWLSDNDDDDDDDQEEDYDDDDDNNGQSAASNKMEVEEAIADEEEEKQAAPPPQTTTSSSTRSSKRTRKA